MLVLESVQENWASIQYECDYCHHIIEKPLDGVARVAQKPGSRVQHLHNHCRDQMPMEETIPYFFGSLVMPITLIEE